MREEESMSQSVFVVMMSSKGFIASGSTKRFNVLRLRRRRIMSDSQQVISNN